MNEKEFAVVAGYLTAAYPAANITNATMNVYYEHLKDIPIQVMERAAARIVETAKFFPSVAELRETCLKAANPEYGKSQAEAVGILHEAISKFGRYRTEEAMKYIKERDITLYHVVKALRFRNLCDARMQSYRTELEVLYRESTADLMKNAQLTGSTMSEILRLSKKLEQEALAMEKEEF